MNKQKLKKYLLIGLISSLLLAGFLGILSILIGGFGALELRIVATTLVIGIFSITGLANLRNLDSTYHNYRLFAKLSILFSLVASLFILSFIWISWEHTPLQPAWIFTILAVSTAHASLLLPARSKSTTLDVIVTLTLVCIAFVAGSLIYLIINTPESAEMFYRLLAVFAILDILGTIIVPILSRFVFNKKPIPAQSLANSSQTTSTDNINTEQKP